MKIKCVIWDLDNTIWRGILNDDESVQIKPKMRNILKELNARGIIQSIVSKNYNNKALNMLKKLNIDKYFIFPQISYNPKSILVEKIINFINIDQENVAFIDDNLEELNEVKKIFKKINTYSANEYLSILSYNEFNVENITEDSKNRVKYLKIKEKRNQEENNFMGLKEDFLKQANTCLTTYCFNKKYTDRIYELVSRTNKYNNMDKKLLNKEDIVQYANKKNNYVIVVDMKDKFGYYGVIGTVFYKIQNKNMIIDIFGISCRILGRGIAISIFSSIINKLFSEKKIQRVFCTIQYTKKNREAIILLNLLDFKIIKRNEELIEFMLDKTVNMKNEEYINIRTEEQNG